MKKFDVKSMQGSKRTLRSGSYAAVLAMAVLAVVILINLVVQALPSKWTEFDISTSSLFTLSDTSKNLLHELNSDVTAYYLAESGQEDTNITRLLDRYADDSSHFSWQQRDPVLYPTFAQQYDGAANGSVVLVCGDNYRVVGYNDMYQMDIETYYTTGSQQYTFEAENALTSALAQASRTSAYKLYQLTGHGELALDSDFTDTLTNAGVTTEELNLTTAGSIPDDADSLLLNAPLADLTEAEAALLSDYVANGGKLLAVTDFTTDTPRLDEILQSCGMTRQDGLLIEADANHYPYGYPQTYLLPTVQSNEITAGVGSGMMVYTPIAQGIVKHEDGDYTFTSLLSTSSTAYSMENYATAETAQKADTDPEGSFDVALAAENTTTGTRVVWINCPNFLQGTINQSVSGGNAQLLGSIVNWFDGEQTTAVISGKSLSAASLSVPNNMIVVLGVLFTLVLPIVCVVAGLVICVIRRRR